MQTKMSKIEELREIFKMNSGYLFKEEKMRNLFNLSFNTVDYMQSQLMQFDAVEYEKSLLSSGKVKSPNIKTALSCSQMLNLYNLIVSAEELEKIYEAMGVGHSEFEFSFVSSDFGKMKGMYLDDDNYTLYRSLSKLTRIERVKTVLSALTFNSSNLQVDGKLYRGNAIIEDNGRVQTIIFENRHPFSLNPDEKSTRIEISEHEVKELYNEVLKWINCFLDKMRAYLVPLLLSSQRLVNLISNIKKPELLNENVLINLSTEHLIMLTHFLENPDNISFEVLSLELKDRILEIDSDLI